MSDRFMNDMACGIEPAREGEEPTLEQWRDQCRKLWADRNKMRLALANLSCMSPHYSDGKFEDLSTTLQRVKKYARDCLA